MDKTIIFVSDFDLKGSGYLNISIPLCKGLAEKGYKIFAIGLNYKGDEHNFPFTIIPCKTFQEVHGMTINLSQLEKTEVIIVALDLPHQGFFLENVMPGIQNMKYICIAPLENPPLTFSWAAPLMNADGVFFISETATKAAHDAGVIDAEHIVIGMEDDWRMPTKEEKERIRKAFGLENKFVVLTVADNQERKNLWAALEMITKAKANGADNLKYILVTREHLTFGYKLRDLTTELGINDEVMIVERGMPFSQLWTYYAASDVFLLTSKAEGLGLPVMEAMSCGVPVMATNTGAIPELLEDGRGYLIPPEYEFRDVWGNGLRSMVDIEAGAKLLQELMNTDMSETAQKAKSYVESRTWDYPVNQLDEKIKEITNE